jgi:asparagine synthase (glutamine-hydrolysing)
MCGFLGEYSINNIYKSNPKDFKRLLKLSSKRGPDHIGFLSGTNFQLGFNRLSIQDLSDLGNQPMQSSCERYHMVFNGEVYNFNQLKVDFNLTNIHSSSDTEVILRLIEKIGVHDAVKQLDGMFAIMVVDMELNKTFLIRDFAGVKPLFYGVSDYGIFAASQFDQVHKHPWFVDNLKLRKDIVKEYFGLGFMMAPNTIFHNIFQVNPGEIVSVDSNGHITKDSFEDFDSENKVLIDEREKSFLEHFENDLSNTIKEQLVSDVPIATFLSGGIDSPLITALAKKHKTDIKAYTIGVDEKTIDESDKAREYADYLQVNHKVKSITKTDLINFIDEHFEAYPEPFGDYSSIPTFLITKEAVKDNTVMLSGDGADELFFGYPKLLHIVLNKSFFYGPIKLRKFINRAFIKLNILSTYAPVIYDKVSEWALGKQLYLPQNLLDSIVPDTLFSIELKTKFDTLDKSSKDSLKLFSALKKNDFYTHMQRVLIKVDRASMGNSLEVRVPFLAKKIIKHGFSSGPKSIDSNYKLKNILKNTLALFLPKSIIFKKKKGFSVPMKSWLRNELKEELIEYIFDRKFYGDNILDVKIVKKYVQDFLDDNHDNEWGVWHIYAWQKWAYSHKLIS